jgi:hypothetical protein
MLKVLASKYYIIKIGLKKLTNALKGYYSYYMLIALKILY